MKQMITYLLAAFFTFSTMHDAAAQDRFPEKPEDISPLLIGEQVPAVMLSDASGKTIDLKAAIAAKPTILIFYRGGWCPYCNIQLSGLQQIEAELSNTGYQVIAVSTDKPENLQKSITKDKLAYTLLSDADLTLAKQMGIAYVAPQQYSKIITEGSGGKNTDKLLPVPSVFILNKKGEIRFEYIEPDFKKRISKDLLRAVALALYKEL